MKFKVTKTFEETNASGPFDYIHDTEEQRETYITVLKDNMLRVNEQLGSELYATCTDVPTSGSVSLVTI
jgi:hypothetical protein